MVVCTYHTDPIARGCFAVKGFLSLAPLFVFVSAHILLSLPDVEVQSKILAFGVGRRVAVVHVMW